MSELQVWEMAVFGAIFAYHVFGFFLYQVVPGLDKSREGEIIRFIAEYKGIELDLEKPMPGINVVELEHLTLPDLSWAAYGGVVDFAIENYNSKYNRVSLIDSCRQNILIHALTHYVQFTYENRSPEYMASIAAEMDAWAVTRAYLKKFHPYRYWVLTIPFGIYCWWTSTPY